MANRPNITRNNHYVPQMYLKRFQSRPGWIYKYDLLVPDEKCPLWTEKRLDRVASASDIYTSLSDGIEVDTHEKWLNTEYETPAEEAIERAVSGSRMSREDWYHLVRFVAAQDVRTPARLHDELERMRTEGPAILEAALEDSIKELKAAAQENRPPQESHGKVDSEFPSRVLIKPSDQEGMAEIRLEVVFGRSMWLAGQRNLLKGIAVHLHQHQWTILQAPEGVTWPASDNPVIRLNYQSAKKYNFGGGWGSNGTEIFMPLNPTRMLYTRIGSKRPERGAVLNFQMAGMLAKFVREHAFRYIFSPTPDELISKLRPRHVSREAYQSEKEQQEKWAQAQVDAELNLNRPLPGG